MQTRKESIDSFSRRASLKSAVYQSARPAAGKIRGELANEHPRANQDSFLLDALHRKCRRLQIDDHEVGEVTNLHTRGLIDFQSRKKQEQFR